VIVELNSTTARPRANLTIAKIRLPPTMFDVNFQRQPYRERLSSDLIRIARAMLGPTRPLAHTQREGF